MKASRFRLFTLCVTIALLTACSELRHSEAGLPPVMYLSWLEDGTSQIFRANIQVGGQEQLTEEKTGVTDYAPSPDGNTVVYAVRQTQAASEGTQIWLTDVSGRARQLLLTCNQAICQQFAWHPDGIRLTYERRELDERGIPGGPRLWWLDSITQETVPLIADRESISSGASFSADGRWISYVGTPDEGIFVRNLDDGRTIGVASTLGTPSVWSPDGKSFVVRAGDIVVLHSEDGENHEDHTHNYVESVHLVAVSVLDGSRTALSGDGAVDDSAPAWSPDGQWIAFGRTQPRTSAGRQLWLVRPDGSEAHALTNEPEINHALAGWSPDGEYLLYQRFPVMKEDAAPEIWIIDVVSGEQSLIASPGFQPVWQP